MIKWDLGEWRDCFHMNPLGHGCKNVERKMSAYAQENRSYDVRWGVVNRGNAVCANIFRTKREADEYRRESASAYVTVRVVITPLYTQIGGLK